MKPNNWWWKILSTYCVWGEGRYVVLWVGEWVYECVCESECDRLCEILWVKNKFIPSVLQIARDKQIRILYRPTASSFKHEYEFSGYVAEEEFD
jgi:hypothetical protein